MDRVVRLRRSRAAQAEIEAEDAREETPTTADLAERVGRLETLVAELQESVDREAVLADEARERGL